MRNSTFESVARVAIRELIEKHVTASKFGYVLTETGMEDICLDIVGLMQTSRNLKAAGDRMIAQGMPSAGSMASFERDKSKRLI